MQPLVYYPLIALALVCAIMLCAWVWGTVIKNYSVVDAFWAANFAVVAVIIYANINTSSHRTLLVSLLAFIWSLRLTLHLGNRIFSHINEEEGRYKQLRKEWANHLHVKFFIFFQMQAISNVLLAFPFFIIALNPSPNLSFIEYVGAAIWAISIVGEAIADVQLHQFKKNSLNKGKVCDVGLWFYSRHPNYFFQLMIWMGVSIFAITAPFGIWSLISPLSIGYLLFKVTGIPMTEAQAIKTRGQAYIDYQQTTSVFIPWFKKKI
ncbi:DUF1295 domain-containing protein [Ferruginibacter yonginensis]|uniref:DUF1295 domain-containing protein n=1 Tax=Ferruginibacter yonginensis TaxID=1310416 RepID=A0ABV8QT68_9BACT